jgi:hypothetical protein
MTSVKNPWVGYLNRNFSSIKERILNRLGETVPEMTDHSNSNILVIIIESFAGVAEMIAYYIDNMAREAFITTARRYSSVVKHTRLIDYRIKARIAASADVVIYFLNNDDQPYPIVTEFTLPIGTKFTTTNNLEFLSTKDIIVPVGTTILTVPTRQRVLVTNDNLGVTTDDPNQVVALGKEYVHDTLELLIGGEPWLLQRTLGLSGPTDKHFIVDISANKEAYIKFGDNINGIIPTPALTILGNYYTSEGSLGNVEASNINASNYNFVLAQSIPKINITNITKAVAGTDYEDIERIRRSAPLSIRTLDRAVTRQDYIDIALLAPGVDKAALYFECGKTVDLYIAPNGGGIANTDLLQSVVTYFDDKKMITTFVRTLPAGESYLHFDISVTGRFRVNGLQLRNELIGLLLDAYSYEKSDINKPIRISDLIALVDNYYKVDFLTLNKIYLKPYLRPTNHVVALNYNIDVNTGSITTVKWKIKYDGFYFKLFKNGTPLHNLIIGETYTDPSNILTITIEAGSYIVGHEWIFETYPYGKDIIVNDFSVPVLREEDLVLSITEQLS